MRGVRSGEDFRQGRVEGGRGRGGVEVRSPTVIESKYQVSGMDGGRGGGAVCSSAEDYRSLAHGPKFFH